MRAVTRLMGPNPTSAFGTGLIGLGLLLLLYAVGMYADLVPGSRVSVPRPPALDRPRPIEPATTHDTPAIGRPASSTAASALPDALTIPEPVAASDPGPATADANQPPPTSTIASVVSEPPLAGPAGLGDAVPESSQSDVRLFRPDPAVYATPMAAADSADRPYWGSRPPPGMAVRVRIPSIELTTDAVEAGVTIGPDGQAEWETVPFVAAHYRETALVGARGNAVVSGHVVTLREGNVFRDLFEIDFGDRVEVDTADGTFTFAVRDIKLVPPSAVEVMAPTNEPTLTLITCGGEFNPRTREFSERLVVTAQLADWARRTPGAEESASDGEN